MKKNLFLLLMLNLFQQFSSAQNFAIDSSQIVKENLNKHISLTISSDTNKYFYLENFDFIADTANQWAIKDISSPSFSSKFISVQIDSTAQIDYNNKSLSEVKSRVYWIRLTIKSNLNYDKEWLFYCPANYTSVYIPKSDPINSFTVKKAGDKTPLKDWDFKFGSDPYIKLLIPGGKEQTIYVHFEWTYENDRNLSFSLLDPYIYLKAEIKTRNFFGPFFGILLLMILYNLILFFSVKDKSYLYYVLFSFTFGVSRFTIYGYGKEFLWPNHPEWDNLLNDSANLAYIFCYVLFAKVFLNTKHFLPKWNKILFILMLAIAIEAAAVLVNDYFHVTGFINDIVIYFETFIFIISYIIVLFPAILCLKIGYRPARYFFFGDLIWILGITITYLGNWLNNYNLIFYSIPTCAVLEIIIFSIGIGERYNLLNKEKTAAQEETIKQLEENEKIKDQLNQDLEEKVKQRTSEVVLQKELVETKNKEITDSIEYALRIQTAILPTQKIIKQKLENSFILYKPKDIVAGDFYWMETIDDLVLFAACDCTGHGVPGAMVSVVCHNALNRAVREFGLTQPAEILDKTAEIVIENFSKSEEKIKDGMDISLCAYNIKTKKLEWAGANNPLWLIKNSELVETKADKQPIGMHDNKRPFTNHQFTLNTGDSIYLFTDGFADQFGGEIKEKKLTRKRFKELLFTIQNLPMPEQGLALEKFLIDYRKKIEQIDDVLVMGVKI